MKRNASCPNYIIREISSTEKTKSSSSESKELSPRDVGNTYITVPVYTMNGGFTKKQIKDAGNMYNLQSTSSHSFVLSLRSDPNTHIAVPYYRLSEESIQGTSFVSVSNFYPVSTIQATPPLGLNVYGFLLHFFIFSIGKTAQLIPVDNDCLRSIFVYPEVLFHFLHCVFLINSHQKPFILLLPCRIHPIL